MRSDIPFFVTEYINVCGRWAWFGVLQVDWQFKFKVETATFAFH